MPGGHGATTGASFIRSGAAHIGVGGGVVGEMNPDPNAKITISTWKVGIFSDSRRGDTININQYTTTQQYIIQQHGDISYNNTEIYHIQTR